ncbi:hypothetical protein AVEN_29206-1 [Araneus ventricosus]|uniref:DUF4817 domain-containing protein n=1 Tax=Araneus ventricosus TaxID=182803 RepID=A0A4Y2AKQ9_ARAVE|nr:hypothetical protein AVEN_29206-1 [Araneus ventricosus]
MSRYSVSERIFIVRTYYSNNKSPIVTQRKFATEFKLKTTGPSVPTINRLIQKFERTGSVCDDMFGNLGLPLSVKAPEKIERTRQVFERSPRTSIRKAAQQVGIKRESVRQIVVAVLQLFPYKIQIHQRSVAQRLEFANTIIEMIDNDQFDVNMLWCSDEAHFHLDVYVNRQNWRIWGTENLHFAIEMSLYPRRVTVWCALSSRGIVGAIFFEQTVNSARYVEALRNQFIPAIQSEPDFESMWFMQDGAAPHCTNEVFDLLEEHFNERDCGFRVPKIEKYGH